MACTICESSCPDLGCSSKMGEGYKCFHQSEVDNTMECAPSDGLGLSFCNDFQSDPVCRCCKPKNVEESCTDVGCSNDHPTYQCLSEKEAANSAKKCIQHSEDLCKIETSEGETSFY